MRGNASTVSMSWRSEPPSIRRSCTFVSCLRSCGIPDDPDGNAQCIAQRDARSCHGGHHGKEAGRFLGEHHVFEEGRRAGEPPDEHADGLAGEDDAGEDRQDDDRDQEEVLAEGVSRSDDEGGEGGELDVGGLEGVADLGDDDGEHSSETAMLIVSTIAG